MDLKLKMNNVNRNSINARLARLGKNGTSHLEAF